MTMPVATPRAEPDASRFLTFETLRDGTRVAIRALQPGDRAGLEAAVARTSPESLYYRFLGPKRCFSDAEVARFMDVDFVSNVALVAVADEGGQSVIIGGARYAVVRPGTAEVAFCLVDRFQGKGLGTALLRHLIAWARRSGLKELVAEVLADNRPMLRVFESCGLHIVKLRERNVVHVVLELV
jgi:RimJ/RimL family protein N-acetyltransferase